MCPLKRAQSPTLLFSRDRFFYFCLHISHSCGFTNRMFASLLVHTDSVIRWRVAFHPTTFWFCTNGFTSVSMALIMIS